MEQMLRLGATAGVIGFVAVGVFALCCVAALAVIGLVVAIARWLRNGGEKND